MLTSLHLGRLDAQWPTENALLIVSTSLIAAWYCGSRYVVVVAFIVQATWCIADINDGIRPMISIAGHSIRAVLTLLLITGTLVTRKKFDDAREAARIDSLTGLPNRRAILAALEAELCRTRRSGRPFSLAMLDCDGFKAINDSRGHLIGDCVLRSVAVGLRKQTRAYDCVGRLGGDEFVMILSDTPGEDVSAILERVRKGLMNEMIGEFPSLTFSIGVVTVKATIDRNVLGPRCDDCLYQADQAMYAAKRSGRDQTRFVTLGDGVLGT